jgi:hypothetical protein
METRWKRGTAITLALAVLLAAATIPSYAEPTGLGIPGSAPPTPDPGVQQQVDDLIQAYEKALQDELRFGETVEVQDPGEGAVLMLAGASAEKIETLWLETVRKINELEARPEEAREPAVRLIQAIEPGDVTYLDRDRSPYDIEADLERYQTSRHIYSVDIATNQVVEITLVDEMSIQTKPVFAVDELEKMAREFVSVVAPGVDLDRLSPTFGDKGGEMFFFRWEDRSATVGGGMPAFIQVGYSQAGDLVHFVNTLPFTGGDGGTAEAAVTFNEVYANGGSYWQWLQGSYNTQNNAGYCYIAGWCSPKNFYWQVTCYGCTSAKGRWKPNADGTERASAFVPSTHATTKQACYFSYYNGGSSSYSKCIRQDIYYDAWVSITSISLYNIRRIDLGNLQDSSTLKEIAWDETWVYTP